MNDGKVVANKDKLIQAIRELDKDTKKSMMEEITYLTNNPEWKDNEVISKRVNQLGRILWLGSNRINNNFFV